MSIRMGLIVIVGYMGMGMAVAVALLKLKPSEHTRHGDCYRLVFTISPEAAETIHQSNKQPVIVIYRTYSGSQPAEPNVFINEIGISGKCARSTAITARYPINELRTLIDPFCQTNQNIVSPHNDFYLIFFTPTSAFCVFMRLHRISLTKILGTVGMSC